MTVLQNILNEDLTKEDTRIIVNRVFEYNRGESNPGYQRTRATALSSAKSLLDFYDLVRRAVDDYQSRAELSQENKIVFTEEEPDINSTTESIVFSLIERVPGQFAQGEPMSRTHANYRPMFREEYNDPENSGYRCQVNGYYYDQIVRFTCWANTNKAANARAEWFEDLMEEYAWWFKLQGVDRVLFWKRGTDLVETISQNKWYGRPIEYFVRTEKLRVFRQKTLEEILIRLTTKRE